MNIVAQGQAPSIVSAGVPCDCRGFPTCIGLFTDHSVALKSAERVCFAPDATFHLLGCRLPLVARFVAACILADKRPAASESGASPASTRIAVDLMAILLHATVKGDGLWCTPVV